jgi:hypothetical protein
MTADNNPYQSPSDERVGENAMGIRSYHIPFLIAAFCVSTVVGALCLPGLPKEWRAGIGGIAAAVLVYALPTCILVVWEWFRTGEMPELNLEPLVPCTERRMLYKAWRERRQLDDKTFYEVFYATSGISPEIIKGVRRELESILGMSLAGVHPGDDISLADPELDFADVFDRFDRAFKINTPLRTRESPTDATFDSLVRFVAAATSYSA